MTYENISRKYRRQINKLLNLVCSLCGESYFTDWIMVTYCDPCIERLEREIE